MTRKIMVNDTTIIIIEVEEDQTCVYCGKIRECRPYGKGGQQICYECGMKDEATTNEEFDKLFEGTESEEDEEE